VTAARPHSHPAAARPIPHGSEYSSTAGSPDANGSSSATAVPRATYQGRTGITRRHPPVGSNHTDAAAAEATPAPASATTAAEMIARPGS
jgi:hypothetical protein